MPFIQCLAAAVLTVCLLGSSCGTDLSTLPEAEQAAPDEPGLVLVARFVHVTDTHAIDTQSPGRFAGATELIPSAWRPQERYSMQVFDGIIRTTNAIHASGRSLDFLLHTGDGCDNDQTNELTWFTTTMDGGVINPLSGPDDRLPDEKPPTLLDPYAPFTTPGLYQQGVHGEWPSIPWYGVIGNHDSFALGNFAVITDLRGRRLAPLPLPLRPGLFLPRYLYSLDDIAYGPVSPANPGPPAFFEIPVPVEPNPERAYLEPGQFIRALQATRTGPAGHGFGVEGDRPYYSVSPLPGLRLIGLNTDDVPCPIPTIPYYQGSLSAGQLDWFRGELDGATARGELVIVATHHPSVRLEVVYGSAVGPDEFRALLNQYSCVVLHLVGHDHLNRVWERDNYVEIETCSTIDYPQEARLIEIWRDPADNSVLVSYGMFSSVDGRWPTIGDDPLRPLRLEALSVAAGSPVPTGRIIGDEAGPATPALDDLPAEGTDHDREGLIQILHRK